MNPSYQFRSQSGFVMCLGDVVDNFTRARDKVGATCLECMVFTWQTFPLQDDIWTAEMAILNWGIDAVFFARRREWSNHQMVVSFDTDITISFTTFT